MRKTSFLLLCAAVLTVAFLSGCGGSNNKLAPNPPTPPSQPSYTPPTGATLTTIPASPNTPVKIYQSLKPTAPSNTGVSAVTDFKSGFDIVLPSQPQGNISVELPAVRSGGKLVYDLVAKLPGTEKWDFLTEFDPSGTASNTLQIPADKFGKRSDGKYVVEGTFVKISLKIPTDTSYSLIQIGSDDPSAARQDKDCVVVHGFVTDYHSLVPLAQDICAAHIYHRVFVYAYPWWQEIGISGHELNVLTKAKFADNGIKLDLVAHSMGVLTARDAMKHTIKGLENVFWICGPNKGASLANLAKYVRFIYLNDANQSSIFDVTRNIPSLKDLMVGSDEIELLDQMMGNTGSQPNVWCFGERYDEIVGYQNGLGSELNFENWTIGAVNRTTFEHLGVDGTVGYNHSYCVNESYGRAQIVSYIRMSKFLKILDISATCSQGSQSLPSFFVNTTVTNASNKAVTLVSAPVSIYDGNGLYGNTVWYVQNTFPLPGTNTVWNKRLNPGGSVRLGVGQTATSNAQRLKSGTMIFSIRYFVDGDTVMNNIRMVVPLVNSDGTAPAPPNDL
ncbi:MAG: hypothetical protein NTW50_01720 [Candidatus Berkelbacteria bacterium]|nr:hypothetical protein [Candidatus Berkelbacteria bacterium]